MGIAPGSRPARGNALRTATSAAPATGSNARLSPDLVVLLAVAALLILGGLMRREFLGDGVRHLPAILSDRVQPGEPRWLLFPPLASVWVRVLAGFELAGGAESALRALVVLSVASGILFLASLRAWLRIETADHMRCAAALLLAASCAPVLILFSDIAEPQAAAAIAAAGLAFARVWRDDDTRADAAALCAAGAIAVASLIYQGMILALGMLPLVVSERTVSRRRALVASGVAVLLVIATLIVVQISTGSSPRDAAIVVVQGEHNPLTRSMMASRSPLKYLAAIVAGPPQGIVVLENFSGLRALAAGVANREPTAITNGILFFVGFGVTGVLVWRGIRDRQCRVLAAAAIVLALPVIRNQQYGYVKFYVLWPMPVALLAMRGRARTVFIMATIVLAANVWLVGDEIRHGRDRHAAARVMYASASASTCWLTSGWAPPFAYLWPGMSTPILGTLATGSDPEAQRTALTASLRHCFCDSDQVWTDTSSRDAAVVTSIARHFDYRGVDLASVLIDPEKADGNLLPGVLVYPDSARQRACSVVR